MKKVEYFSISGQKLKEPIDWDRVHSCKTTEYLTTDEVMKKYNLTPQQWQQAIKNEKIHIRGNNKGSESLGYV